MATLCILLLAIAAPPNAVEPKRVSDGGFNADLSVEVVSVTLNGQSVPLEAEIAVTLHGRNGAHSVYNPFFEPRLSTTCHVLIYNASLSLIDVLGSDGAVLPADLDDRSVRLNITPDLATGRLLRFRLPRDDGEAVPAPYYAQAVLLDTAMFRATSPLEFRKTKTARDYAAWSDTRLMGASSPVELALANENSWREGAHSRPTVSIELDASLARLTPRGRSHITARIFNGSEDPVYVAPYLFMPVKGNGRRPSIAIETADNRQIALVPDDYTFWPKEAIQVCRLPPSAFIKCENVFDSFQAFEAATASAVLDGAPLFFRLVDVPIFTDLDRRADSGVVSTWPPTWSFRTFRGHSINRLEWPRSN